MSDTIRAFSIREAAERAGCCKDLIYGAINGGQLRARRLGSGRTVILAQDLAEFLNSLPSLEPKSVA